MRYLAKQIGNSTFILKDEEATFEVTLKVAKRKLLSVQELDISTKSKTASIYFENKGLERLKAHCYSEFEYIFEKHTSGLQLHRKNEINLWSQKKITAEYSELDLKELRMGSKSIGFFGEIEGNLSMTNEFTLIADLSVPLNPENNKTHFIIACFLIYSLYVHRFYAP